MATYYKYQERDPSSEINWAEVGANFSGMLKAEKETRENKKQAIDDATREQQRILDNAVQGDSANMNQWALDYAANATEQLQMTNRLMKSGDLSMKEYTMMRQNTSDGTDQAFTLAQEYQTEYADKMARADCKDPEGVGCSQQLELEMMASAEGFGNFNKSQLVINPQTGKVMVGFYRDNGNGVMELDSSPGNLVGINNLRNRIKGKVELYDMAGAVENAVKSFGEFETITRTIGSLNKKGLLLNISDPTLRGKEIKDAVKSGHLSQADADLMTDWEDVQDFWLEGELTNPLTVSSLLTNNLGRINGKTYKFVWDEKDVDEFSILLKNVDGTAMPDWETEWGKAQKEAAKQGLKTVLQGALDHKVKQTTVSDSPGWKPVANQRQDTENEEQQNATEIWNEMYTADSERRQVLSDALISSPQGKKEGLSQLIFVTVADPNGGMEADGTTPLMVDAVEFYYKDPDKNRTGSNAQLLGTSADEHSLAGIEITGQTNKEKRMVGLNEDAVMGGTTRSGVSSGRDIKEDATAAANTFIRQEVTGDLGINQGEENFVTAFESKFNSLGFTTITPTNSMQKVEIHHPNAATPHLMYTNYSGAKGKKRQDNLRDWMTQFITDAQADAWMKTGIGNSGKETKAEREAREAADASSGSGTTKKKLPGS